MQPGSLNCVILCPTPLPRVANHWPNFLTNRPVPPPPPPNSLSSAAFSMVLPLLEIFFCSYISCLKILVVNGPPQYTQHFFACEQLFLPLPTKLIVWTICLLIFQCLNSCGIVLFYVSHYCSLNRKYSRLGTFCVPDLINRFLSVKPDTDMAPAPV